MHLEMSVSKILIDSRASMVHQNYQKILVLTSGMIHIVALGVGFKCPRKIHLNTQCLSPLALCPLAPLAPSGPTGLPEFTL